MKDIKTRESKVNIKALDKGAGFAKTSKSAAVRTKELTQNLANDGQVGPDEYAQNKVKFMSKKITGDIGSFSAKTFRKSIKTGRRAVKTVNQSFKTARKSAKAAKQTAEKSTKASKMSVQSARLAATAVYRATVLKAKAIAAAVKAAVAGVKALVAAIIAGGWVAVVIIIVICLIAMIAGSCFGIFFSGDDTGSRVTLQTALSEIDNEFEARINEIKETNTYDVFEISGSRAEWSDVLAVYAVKTAGDSDNPTEVASMDESKKQALKEVFWLMNEISYTTATKRENVAAVTDEGDDAGTSESITRVYLYIQISHKSVDEMSEQYGFNDSQKKQLRELMSEDNKKLWNSLINIDFIR